MRVRTIQSKLRSKFSAWVATIDDEFLRKDVMKHTIITGGCITSMLQDERVNDYDVYFDNPDTCLAVAQYYVDQFNKENTGYSLFGIGAELTEDRVRIRINSGVAAANDVEAVVPGVLQDPGVPSNAQDTRAPGNHVSDTAVALKASKSEEKTPKPYRPVYLTSNAITLTDKIQIVIRFYGAPDELHKNFDFVHCTNYWYSGNGKLTLRRDALASIMTHELRYVGSRYPLSAMFRIRKFYHRGWWASAGQMLKIIYQIQELDLSDPVVLEEQLMGMDFAYFLQLINVLTAKLESDPGFELTGTYVSALIDRLDAMTSGREEEE